MPDDHETAHFHEMLCPQCLTADDLQIRATTLLSLEPEGTDTDGHHDYGRESWATCECDWCGLVKDLSEAYDAAFNNLVNKEIHNG